MPSTNSSPPRRALWELCVGYGLILLVLWTPHLWQRRLYGLTAAFLLIASLRTGESWRTLGFSRRNALRSSFIAVVALTLCALMAFIAARQGTLHAPHSLPGFIRRFWGYAIWSFAQQFLLQDFFLLRLRRLLPGHTTAAVITAAAIFAAAHLPNPVLTLFTLVWGLVACAAFVRWQNLYPLAIAHALLGITVAVCLPGAATHNMHVGLGYFHWQHPQRSQSDHTVSTRVWVTAEAATRRSLRQARP